MRKPRAVWSDFSPEAHYRIALAIPEGVPHLEDLAHGIRGFAESHGEWEFVTSPETHSIAAKDLKDWDGDGAFVMANEPRDLEAIQSLRGPVINLSGALSESSIPRVRIDYYAAGRSAAQHLLQRGFERFAFYGLQNVFYAETLGKGFADRIKEEKNECNIFHARSSFGPLRLWENPGHELDQWLGTLTPPIGLLASHDPRALQVVHSCRRLGLRVPNDVSVIGLNNDIQSCELCEPPLTSISRRSREVGWEAARMMERLLTQEKTSTEDLVLPPGEIVERASTDTFASSNASVAQAIRYIHDHLHEQFTINDILTKISKSRRWLETSFQETVRASPYSFIVQERVKHAQTAIRKKNNGGLKEIAYNCGFTGTKQMNRAFLKCANQSPQEYKEKLS